MAEVIHVPGTSLEVTAYVVRGCDLCVVLNTNSGECIGRILIEQLCQFEDLSQINIGYFRLVPEPRR
jgi:hypothetical protein